MSILSIYEYFDNLWVSWVSTSIPTICEYLGVSAIICAYVSRAAVQIRTKLVLWPVWIFRVPIQLFFASSTYRYGISCSEAMVYYVVSLLLTAPVPEGTYEYFASEVLLLLRQCRGEILRRTIPLRARNIQLWRVLLSLGHGAPLYTPVVLYSSEQQRRRRHRTRGKTENMSGK